MDKHEQQNIDNEEQQNEVQAESTPLSPSSSHKKLIISIAAVVVLVVAVAVGGYFLFQSKSQPDSDIPLRLSADGVDASSWQSYHSEQFAFKIQYPKDWDAQEISDGVNIRNYNNILKAPKPIRQIEISYLENINPERNEINVWLDNHFSSGFFANVTLREKISIDGYEAVKMQNFGVGERGSIYIKRKSDIISITYELDPEYNDFYNEIISTLKFTEFNESSYNKLLTEEQAFIVGQDNDNDGIWDYIQTYIESTYPNSEKTRAMLTQYAKRLQAALLDSRNKQASTENARDIQRAIECAFYILSEDGASITSDLRAEILNTDERALAYLRFNEQLGGEVFNSRSLSKWHLSCDFNVDELEN